MFKLYNTMSRKLEELVPLEDNHIRLYTCGPTVYNYAHIGNYRAYMFEDLLRRWLQYKGFKVTQVQNLTDVDDKTIRGSRETGLPLREYTQKYKEAFFDDLKALNIQPAEYYPAATDCIPEMIALIEKLFEKGLAYKSDDGSVYFPIDKFPEYGKLAHLDREGMRAGARVAQDEYDKDNAADFALWKGYVDGDGDVFWDSPWGKGRPGWHIECSAMSMKYLGKSFDLHTGGVDNIFPHHEDEIAQSEGANGCLYSKYWMHCAHLQVEGKKMSKSEGNFFTLREIFDKGYTGREVRYELIGTHYRQSLNFTFSSLAGARAALGRLDEFYTKLRDKAGSETDAGELPEWAVEMEKRFTEALDDDLNFAGALGALFDAVHEGNKALADMDAKTALAIANLWKQLDTVLAFLEPPKEDVPAELVDMANARVEAKKNKDWAEADRLRDAVAAAGWTIQDTPEGPKLKKA